MAFSKCIVLKTLCLKLLATFADNYFCFLTIVKFQNSSSDSVDKDNYSVSLATIMYTCRRTFHNGQKDKL